MAMSLSAMLWLLVDISEHGDSVWPRFFAVAAHLNQDTFDRIQTMYFFAEWKVNKRMVLTSTLKKTCLGKRNIGEEEIPTFPLGELCRGFQPSQASIRSLARPLKNKGLSCFNALLHIFLWWLSAQTAFHSKKGILRICTFFQRCFFVLFKSLDSYGLQSNPGSWVVF